MAKVRRGSRKKVARPHAPRKVPRRKQVDLPFSIPKDEKLKAIMKLNTTESPLLRLPLEIRLSIWGYVLGHQTIHIKGRDTWHNGLRIGVTDSPSHIICEATTTEREAYELSRSASYEQYANRMLDDDESDEPDERYCEIRHQDCYSCFEFDDPDAPRKTLDLRMLRVCRRMYDEGSQVLWSTTLFSFLPFGDPGIYNAYTWNSFCTSRTPFQRQMIRKIHLGDDAWNDHIQQGRHLTRRIASKFKQLDELYIDVGLPQIHAADNKFENNTIEVAKLWLPRHFFRAKNIYVNCRGVLFSPWPHVDLTVSWKKRVETADKYQLHLRSLQSNMKRRA